MTMGEIANSRVVCVALGLCHSVFVTDTSYVYVCGKGDLGRLGMLGNDASFNIRTPTRLIVKDDKGSEQRIVYAAAGGAFTALLNSCAPFPLI